MSNKILSICVPVFNKINFTLSCLKDLSKLPDDHEIIIIDNGSTDNTEEEIKKISLEPSLHNKLVYKKNKINLGFARASNRAYSITSAPNVLFLNNDIRVKSNFANWTEPLIKEMESEVLVGPTMGELDNNLNFIRESNSLLISHNAYMSGWCLGACKTIWNKLIPQGQLGPFSEDFFCYFEDTDLSFRANNFKIPFRVVDIPVVHFGKQTSSQLNTRQLYLQAREIFIRKWKLK